MKQQELAASSSSSSSQSPPPTLAFAPNSGGAATATDDPSSTSSSPSGDSLTLDRRNPNAVVCRWSIPLFPRLKSRALWSKYFALGPFDCRLLVYPRGDSQALPGYLSIYLQIIDPRGTCNSKWDCFASYRLSIENQTDSKKSISRDSWHRFSGKKKSHGWCDFTPLSNILDTKNGFLVSNETVVVSADIMVLDEHVSFSNEDGLSGKFTWKVKNFSLFRDMIKTQKIMSPVFPAGECNLRISVYQSVVGGVEHLSMCLESKDTEKGLGVDRSCWCLFRMTALNQKPGLNHMHRDSYGRFAADNKGGDNTSLGWNDYTRMSEFVGKENGYLVDDTAVFSTSFHVIKEGNSFTKNVGVFAGSRGAMRKMDGHFGKFTWRIDNFTRLKDLLKKRKITGLCVKSRRFQIGNRDCRLIVYPRGQSQPPCHLSVFLEVTDSRNSNNDWSCFVSHRLSVVNQKMEEKSVTKESQNRYSKAAKDWGWREFVTLTSLFGQDSGFLVQDTVVFSAEVLILKETSIMEGFSNQNPDLSSPNLGFQINTVQKKGSFIWKVENFLSFKEIMETRKIFSKFFQAGGCELRIGVYESFDTICIYLESDQSSGSDPDKNFWVKYRMAVQNQKNPAKTVWKESSILTKTWNNSVLQFMKVSDLLESDAGFLVRDTVIFVCDIIDSSPWFDFASLEVLFSEDDQEALSTNPDEYIDYEEESESISGDEEDMFRNLLSRAGFHLTCGEKFSQPQVNLREKLLSDAGAMSQFLTDLRDYLDNPSKVKRLLLPTKISKNIGSKNDATRCDTNSPSLMNLLMGVKVIQQAIIDLLLDIMVECCQPSGSQACSDSGSNGDCTPSERSGDNDIPEYEHIYQRLESEANELSLAHAVQSSDLNPNGIVGRTNPEQPICPPETSASGLVLDDGYNRGNKTKWPEQSEELLALIVNSLRTLDCAVPQGCPEPRRRPQSLHKILLVLDKAPIYLQLDLISVVPKLIDHSEHTLAACALLERLQVPDAEPSLRLPVFGALIQLDIGSEVWERVLLQAFKFLTESNDEPLIAALGFVFKAASQCQLLPRAARAVRSKLKTLGTNVPQCVLDVLSNIVHNGGDEAKAILRDIDSNCELDDSCTTEPYNIFSSGINGVSAVETNVANSCQNLSDVYILIELLSITNLFVDVSQVFERAIVRGAIGLRSVSMVLDRRQSMKLVSKSSHVVENSNSNIKQVPLDENRMDDFTSLLSLGEVLSHSRDTRVQDFVRMLYAIMFKIYSEEHYRVKMLKVLVDRAITSSDNCRVADVDMDVLVFLVREEDGVARPVINMMREVVELAQVDRATLWHQLCELENDNIRSRVESQKELSDFSNEKDVLNQRLSESEAATIRLKSELKAEVARSAKEKRELSDRLNELGRQLDWVRSEKDEESQQFSSDRKTLQDRLHDAETQLSQLKSRKLDELKRVMKEKNVLAERLKNAEAARKRSDDELKRYINELKSREEERRVLEDEVKKLKRTVGQTEEEKKEKEVQVTRCEEYIDEMQSRLTTCQQYIQNLEKALHDEQRCHTLLCGDGLDSLTMDELDAINNIHESGLQKIYAAKQKRSGTNPSLFGGNTPQPIHSLYPTNLPMPIGTPLGIFQNNLGSQGNGHFNSGVGAPWFNPTN